MNLPHTNLKYRFRVNFHNHFAQLLKHFHFDILPELLQVCHTKRFFYVTKQSTCFPLLKFHNSSYVLIAQRKQNVLLSTSKPVKSFYRIMANEKLFVLLTIHSISSIKNLFVNPFVKAVGLEIVIIFTTP